MTTHSPNEHVTLLFWTASALMLVFGAAVIINRNPVASALSLVVSFLGLAALFMSLDAFFIGIIQVLVYAGAVMVLFLFIIMLLDLRRRSDAGSTSLLSPAARLSRSSSSGSFIFVIGQLAAGDSLPSLPCLAAERRRA